MGGGLEYRLTDVVERLGAGFQLLDRELRYVYLNEAVEVHARRKRNELLGQRMQEAYPGIENTDMFVKLTRCLETGETTHLENEFTYPDGKRRWFALSIQPVSAGVVVMSFDVTQRKELQRQLLQAQRLEAVGRLASGIAHDFNNLLTTVETAAVFALESQPPGSSAANDLNDIRGAVSRATALTRKLLAFASQRAESPRNVDLNAELLELERLLRRVLGDDVVLRLDLAENLRLVSMDPVSFEQIVLNLAVNARDAMPEGGDFVLSTRNVEIEGELRLRWGRPVAEGDYVQLAVTDSGVGMTPEVQEHIFEPFFTTKGPGVGTGLGLSTCFGLVEQAGGYISVYSEPGRGTTFRIYLPHATRPDVPHIVGTRPAPPRGRERVAVVEDDAYVRVGMVRILRGLGYAVVEVERPLDAVEQLTAQPVDLLIADVVMPGIVGPELATRLRQTQQALRVLYVSGFPGGVALQRRIVEAGDPLLEKPFAPATLARTVRDVLSQA